MDNQEFQQGLIEELVKNRKKDRLWRNIRFFIGIFVIVFYASFLIFHRPSLPTSSQFNNKQPYVSLLELNGEIKAGGTFSADNVIPQLRSAFDDPNTQGVIIDINSPGGSPVQASRIHDEILRLENETHKKTIVVGEDALASGAYLVATAANKIYVNQATLTGSIGVILSGFGFNDAMQKIGIQRRVFTAGGNKDRLDPFEPLTPQDIKKINSVLDSVHQQFISYVMAGRRNKLVSDDRELFSGDFWTGSQAVKLGLADGIGSVTSVMNKEFHVNQYKDYTPRPSFFQALLGGVGTVLHLGLSSDHIALHENFGY